MYEVVLYMRKQLSVSLLIFILLIIGTVLAVFYGRGYRLDLGQGSPKVSKTGLLVATSLPDGAQVFINGNLSTATNSTLDLTPGEYTVKITKEGYFPWEKKLRVVKELVTKADALLIPTAPKLESITTLGADRPVLDPSGSKIAYTVASQSARKNGIYVYDMNARSVLSLQTAARQITDDTVDLFSTADLSWSPDGEFVIATISGQTTYLLNATQLNQSPRNITATLPSFQSQFQLDIDEKAAAQIVGLRAPVKKMIAENFNIIAWSPDDTKILYTASRSAQLDLMIKPRLLGVDTLREVRNINEGSVYVYDIKEDRNTLILNADLEKCEEDAKACLPRVNWFPDSEHLIYVLNNQIHLVELDGTNNTVIYAGPFINGFVFPWPNGSRLVILTNLNNSSILPNLYTISLK